MTDIPLARTSRAPFAIADIEVAPARTAKLELPISRLVSGTPVTLPVLVVHGRDDGPTVWLSAAIHGDEICGVEVIRQVLDGLDARRLSGTVLAVPVVNVHGFNTGDRYLPDRRDLNRSFPGSPRGSLASRIAHLMMSEIIARCDVGIDLHTGSDHRVNLPHVRADLDDDATLALARVFAAPLAMHARTRDGSLRQAGTDRGATVLVFEGGEASRFDEAAIDVGIAGIRRVLSHLGMVADGGPSTGGPPRLARQSQWVRATQSGIFHLDVRLGDVVDRGDLLGVVHDTFGKRVGRIRARTDGMVVGHTQYPLVNRGDALVHLARLEAP